MGEPERIAEIRERLLKAKDTEQPSIEQLVVALVKERDELREALEWIYQEAKSAPQEALPFSMRLRAIEKRAHATLIHPEEPE